MTSSTKVCVPSTCRGPSPERPDRAVSATSFCRDVPAFGAGRLGTETSEIMSQDKPLILQQQERKERERKRRKKRQPGELCSLHRTGQIPVQGGKRTPQFSCTSRLLPWHSSGCWFGSWVPSPLLGRASSHHVLGVEPSSTHRWNSHTALSPTHHRCTRETRPGKLPQG